MRLRELAILQITFDATARSTELLRNGEPAVCLLLFMMRSLVELEFRLAVLWRTRAPESMQKKPERCSQPGYFMAMKPAPETGGPAGPGHCGMLC
jgi:hypothetical protein